MSSLHITYISHRTFAKHKEGCAAIQHTCPDYQTSIDIVIFFFWEVGRQVEDTWFSSYKNTTKICIQAEYKFISEQSCFPDNSWSKVDDCCYASPGCRSEKDARSRSCCKEPSIMKTSLNSKPWKSTTADQEISQKPLLSCYLSLYCTNSDLLWLSVPYRRRCPDFLWMDQCS